jgi:hypothetical protein
VLGGVLQMGLVRGRKYDMRAVSTGDMIYGMWEVVW